MKERLFFSMHVRYIPCARVSRRQASWSNEVLVGISRVDDGGDGDGDGDEGGIVLDDRSEPRGSWAVL